MELGEGLDVQLLGHIGAGKGLFLGLLVELLGVFQLVFVVLQLLPVDGPLNLRFMRFSVVVS